MTGYVYAMLSCERVKIGYSERPRQRIHDANTMSPFRVDLIGFIEGNIDQEANLHECFSDLRVHGEWFSYSGPVKVWADSLGFVDLPKTSPILDKTITKLAIVTVADWLRENFFKLKREKKLTQSKLAAYLGVSQSKVAKMVDGSRGIRSDEIPALEAFFDVKYSSTPIQEPAE